MHEMVDNGGAGDGRPHSGGTCEAGGDRVTELVDGLRGGDLAFVFAVVTRLGTTIADHPDAPAGASDRFVQDVALALADLAVAPDAADRAASDLLAAAIRSCHTPSADWGPQAFASP